MGESVPFRETNSGILIFVRLTPKARSNRIDGIAHEDTGQARLKVKVRAVPKKGAASTALIGLLAKTLDVAKSSLSLVSGTTDRRKTILLTGNHETMRPLLQALLNRLESAT